MGLRISAAILVAQSFRHWAVILVVSQRKRTILLGCRDDDEDDRRASKAGRRKKKASPEAEEEPEIVLDESSTWKPLQHAKLPAVLDFLHGIAASANSKKPLKMLPATAKLRATLLLHREKVPPWQWLARALQFVGLCRNPLEGVLQQNGFGRSNRV